MCLALFNLSAYSQEQTNENIIMSGATVFVDLNKNRILDSGEPIGHYQGGNRYTVNITQNQAETSSYKEGLATLNIIGGIGLDLGQDSTLYLNSIVNNNPRTSITEQVLENIEINNELKAIFTKELNVIDDSMNIIRSTIPEFLSLNLELEKTPLTLLGDQGTSNKSLNKKKKSMRGAVKSHRNVLIKNSKKLNSKIKSIRKLANKNNILEITQPLNALIQSGVIVNNDFKINVHNELVTSISNINKYWEKISKELSGEDSLINAKEVEVDIKLSLIISDINNKDAIKFLSLATFGATKESIESLKSLGIEKWVNRQLALPYVPNNHLRETIIIAKGLKPSRHTADIEAYIADNEVVFNKNQGDPQVRYAQTSAWFQNTLLSEDQLRHRTAYALSQIIVESMAEPLFRRRAEALSSYFDILTKHSFGNYRDLLLEISRSASMGLYLTYHANRKEQWRRGAHIFPDENYARELMQLFTIGLSDLNLDGTEKIGDDGYSIPSYTQTDVNEIAKVFTGWDMRKNQRFGRLGAQKDGDATQSMHCSSNEHEFTAKRVLGTDIPAGISCEADMEAVIDILMAHENMAPFISKQLIMRLVKSNPSPAYVARVATVFNDNGEGVKGDLKAVVKAILLDSELWGVTGAKKFKEPLMAYTEFLRAFGVDNLPVWAIRRNKNNVVENKVYFHFLNITLGQEAGRAYSVFNFYDNDYIPNDSVFKRDNLFAPELQIQSDRQFILFSNKIRANLMDLEKNYLISQYGDLSDIDNVLSFHRPKLFDNNGVDKFTLDCTDEYRVMEEALKEESIDAIFEKFNHVNRANDTTADADGETNRDRALKALIEALDTKLLSSSLSQEKKELLFEHYKEEFYSSEMIKSSKPTRRIYVYIIVPIIVAIVTSENFMVQE